MMKKISKVFILITIALFPIMMVSAADNYSMIKPNILKKTTTTEQTTKNVDDYLGEGIKCDNEIFSFIFDERKNEETGVISASYWTYIKIIAVAGALVLMTVDFIGPILSSDNEALVKAGGKAVKRTAALLIFIALPLILRIIFGLFGIPNCF